MLISIQSQLNMTHCWTFEEIWIFVVGFYCGIIIRVCSRSLLFPSSTTTCIHSPVPYIWSHHGIHWLSKNKMRKSIFLLLYWFYGMLMVNGVCCLKTNFKLTIMWEIIFDSVWWQLLPVWTFNPQFSFKNIS